MMSDPINIMIQLLQVSIPLILGTILFTSTLATQWRWLVAILLFMVISSPFMFIRYGEEIHPVINANLDLENSMLFVWSCSALLGLVALIRILLKIKSSKN